MTQMTITITDVFAFTDKIITIKGTILVIEVSILIQNKSTVTRNSYSDHSKKMF